MRKIFKDMLVLPGKPSFAVRLWLIAIKDVTSSDVYFKLKTYNIREVLFICAHGAWFLKLYICMYCTEYFFSLLFFLLIVISDWGVCFNAKHHSNIILYGAWKKFSYIFKLAVIEHKIAVEAVSTDDFLQSKILISLWNNTRKWRQKYFLFAINNSLPTGCLRISMYLGRSIPSIVLYWSVARRPPARGGGGG